MSDDVSDAEPDDDAGAYVVAVLLSRKERTTLASLSHSFLTSLYECGSRVARQAFRATPRCCRGTRRAGSRLTVARSTIVVVHQPVLQRIRSRSN